MDERLNKPGIADPLLFLGRQAPGWMRLRARQSSVKLALLSWLGATSGATNRQSFLIDVHDYIMQYSALRRMVNSDQKCSRNPAFFDALALIGKGSFPATIGVHGSYRFHENSHLMNGR
jgi:hypothetical protein